MDEILIFGKSHTLRVGDAPLDDNERDLTTGMLKGYEHDTYTMFKMEPLFFGYIESINKTFDASRGCMITINAKDHMKLLEISQCITNAGSLIGHVMPSVNFSLEYGLASFSTSEIEKYNIDENSVRYGVDKERLSELTYTDIYEKAKNYGWMFTQCMRGLFIDEIVQIQCACAGIPAKFLKKRIEPNMSLTI